MPNGWTRADTEEVYSTPPTYGQMEGTGQQEDRGS